MESPFAYQQLGACPAPPLPTALPSRLHASPCISHLHHHLTHPFFPVYAHLSPVNVRDAVELISAAVNGHRPGEPFGSECEWLSIAEVVLQNDFVATFVQRAWLRPSQKNGDIFRPLGRLPDATRQSMPRPARRGKKSFQLPPTREEEEEDAPKKSGVKSVGVRPLRARGGGQAAARRQADHVGDVDRARGGVARALTREGGRVQAEAPRQRLVRQRARRHLALHTRPMR